MGKCHIEITLGETKNFKSDVIIADIKDDALLGMDILNSGSKAADIILSENRIILNGQEIKMRLSEVKYN